MDTWVVVNRLFVSALCLWVHRTMQRRDRMTPMAVFLGIFGPLVAGAVTIVLRRMPRIPSRTSYLQSLKADLESMKLEMAANRREHRAEIALMQAALQSFKDRDGVWFELWHDQNVALSAAGVPVVQLPDKLRSWPDAIATATNGIPNPLPA